MEQNRTYFPLSAANAVAPTQTLDCNTAMAYSGTYLELVEAIHAGLWPTSAEIKKKYIYEEK